MPVIAQMGGSGGSQALTVITRGIALGEIEFSSGFRTAHEGAFRRPHDGHCDGCGRPRSSPISGLAIPSFGLALVLAMVTTMAVSGLMGAAVPLLLKALHQDPALGSGVIVIAFNDAFALFSFLGIATLLLDRLA